MHGKCVSVAAASQGIGVSVVAAIEDADVAVESSTEHRPSFDDVFASLVSRHRRELARAEAEAATEEREQAA